MSLDSRSSALPITARARASGGAARASPDRARAYPARAVDDLHRRDPCGLPTMLSVRRDGAAASALPRSPRPRVGASALPAQCPKRRSVQGAPVSGIAPHAAERDLGHEDERGPPSGRVVRDFRNEPAHSIWRGEPHFSRIHLGPTRAPTCIRRESRPGIWPGPARPRRHFDKPRPPGRGNSRWLHRPRHRPPHDAGIPALPASCAWCGSWTVIHWGELPTDRKQHGWCRQSSAPRASASGP